MNSEKRTESRIPASDKLSLSSKLVLGGVLFLQAGWLGNLGVELYRDKTYTSPDVLKTMSAGQREIIWNSPSANAEVLIPFYSFFSNRYETALNSQQ